MIKRKLRFFCDYMAETPLWESYTEPLTGYPEREYNKTKGTLCDFGVTGMTLSMMETLLDIFEFPSSEISFTPEEESAFCALQTLIVMRLENEVGSRFELEVF